MPLFEIEQYEIHTQKYRVEAGSEAEAVQRLFEGHAEAVDGSLELIGVCDDLGLPVEEFPALANELRLAGVTLDDGRIPSVRSIDQV